MSSPSGWQRGALRAGIGCSIGLGLLYLAVERIGWGAMLGSMSNASPAWIMAAMGLYAAALSGRVLRWQLMLRRAGAAATFAEVAGLLIVGYAANFLLPARLGEFVRAADARRKLVLPASTVLGTIIVERLLDGLFVVTLLALALGLLAIHRESDNDFGTVALVAGTGCIVMASAALIAFALCRSVDRLSWLPGFAVRAAEALTAGLACFSGGARLPIIALTLPIWLLEAAAIAALLRALGTDIPPLAAVTLISVASLSTLLPTAPGYLGSYQLAFAVSLRLFQLPETLAVAAAGLAQIYLFGGTVLAAGLMLATRALGLFPASSVQRSQVTSGKELAGR